MPPVQPAFAARWEVGPGTLKQLSGLEDESDIRAVPKLIRGQSLALERIERPNPPSDQH